MGHCSVPRADSGACSQGRDIVPGSHPHILLDVSHVPMDPCCLCRLCCWPSLRLSPGHLKQRTPFDKVLPSHSNNHEGLGLLLFYNFFLIPSSSTFIFSYIKCNYSSWHSPGLISGGRRKGNTSPAKSRMLEGHGLGWGRGAADFSRRGRRSLSKVLTLDPVTCTHCFGQAE